MTTPPDRPDDGYCNRMWSTPLTTGKTAALLRRASDEARRGGRVLVVCASGERADAIEDKVSPLVELSWPDREVVTTKDTDK